MGSSESTPAAVNQLLERPANKPLPGAASATSSTAATNAGERVFDLTSKNGTARREATKAKPVSYIEEGPGPKHRPVDVPDSVLEKMRTTTDAKPSADDIKKLPKAEQDVFHYTKLRDDLFAFSLGEAAYQYATRLYKESPENPAVCALLAETAFIYEKQMVKQRREHWVDRCDTLQHGIDVSRKCVDEHPDYGPCYRSYVLCVSKMSDTEVWFRRWKPLSLFRHYNTLQTIGDRALDLYPSTDVAMNLANVSGRCATRLRHWYSPWHPLARWYGIPYQKDILRRAEKLLRICVEREPNNLEMACRLGEVLFELGEENEAKRWYRRCRDELSADDPKAQIWQSVAHTHLVSHFDKPSWNLPFG